MISIRKLNSLKPSLRLRRTAKAVKAWEDLAASGARPDFIYLKSVFLLLSEYPDFRTAASRELENLRNIENAGSKVQIVRVLNSIRHAIYRYLDTEPADWDFISVETGRIDPGGRKILPLSVYLEDIRSPFNVGSIFRTAESFGTERIYISGQTVSPEHRRAVRASMGCTEIVPWEIREPLDFGADEGIFALELGGIPVDRFEFPETGMVIVGSEELGVSPEMLKIAENSRGRVSIPVFGAKGSLNVSVAFGILMSRWLAYLKRSD